MYSSRLRVSFRSDIWPPYFGRPRPNRTRSGSRALNKTMLRAPILTVLLCLVVAAPAAAQSRGAPMRPLTPATGWSANAAQHRGHHGRLIRINCPANGRAGSVWGSGPYTDDSSICTAAVHRGFISVATGGHVVVAVRPGMSAYVGTKQHGVTSSSYAKWHGSFIVISGVPHTPVVTPHPGATTITWTRSAAAMRGSNGQVASFVCPANGRVGSVWGTHLYTDDSSICSAAVHAGVITATSGGVVNIEIRSGAASYAPSTHNGVRSQKWARWQGSFIVHGSTLPSGTNTPPTQPGTISWSDNATRHRGSNGKTVTVFCPANGRLRAAVWGDGTYTDDSSICAAAVHAGRITLRAGGSVTLLIRPGLKRYPAVQRNGVNSNRWAAWTGSFVFTP